MTARLLQGLALASAAFAASCAHDPAPENARTATTADQHRILVTETTERLSVPVAADDVVLSPELADAVQRFARTYIRAGHGALVMSVPQSESENAAPDRIGEHVRMRLAEAGVPYNSIARASYNPVDAGAPILLSFLVYDAQAPTCDPLWTQDLAHNSDNVAWKSFGCSQQANLAAMIANPGDLLGPRDEDPRDATRRAVVLEKYRQGEQTHAERSADERVQVSEVAK
jgi:pilus assembly protein CpaD